MPEVFESSTDISWLEFPLLDLKNAILNHKNPLVYAVDRQGWSFQIVLLLEVACFGVWKNHFDSERASQTTHSLQLLLGRQLNWKNP